MGRPARVEQFNASEIGIVHTIQRCVRRAFLTGVDEKTGKDYSYRREWIRRRMEALASVFGIDVLTYAIMSNHIHLILRNRPDVVAKWSDAEVALRWLRVFPGRRLDEQLSEPTTTDVQTLASNPERLAEIRLRLSDISWFMRALCEPIARQANRQDECTGRFWEGRFKAQRIADETGLLACAMYVDLNPVRAAMAESPEEAEHTSAYDRIHAERGAELEAAAFDLVAITAEEAGKEIRTTPVNEFRRKRAAKRRNATGRRIKRDAWLAPLRLDSRKLSGNPELHQGGVRASDKGFLNLSVGEYLTLLNWTAGKKMAELARGIPKKLQQLLDSLGVDPSLWRDLVWNYKRYFGQSCCAGRPESLVADAQRIGKRFHRGQRKLETCFSSGT
ncbi:MAG: hypothetical protein KDB03_18800 [Planctomycetales bacterium]|nr:hypothetical protein [Planctomycetales bacterium]